MSLFQLGRFRLNSGAESAVKIECDNLDAEDWQCLAFLLHARLPRFSVVEGVPTGGHPLAKALQPYANDTGPLLIVDDVLTTGGSMNRQRGDRAAIGAVIFARQRPPTWITALFVMSQEKTGE